MNCVTLSLRLIRLIERYAHVYVRLSFSVFAQFSQYIIPLAVHPFVIFLTPRNNFSCTFLYILALFKSAFDL